MTTNNAINLNDAGLAYYDGAGNFSGVALTNGQIPIGSTGIAPVAATLTAGAGVTITPGAGTITIAAAGGGFQWNTSSTNVANMAVNNGYFAISPGGALTFGLPAVSALGAAITLNLAGATSWQITQPNAGSQIRLGNQTTTLGVGGTLTSTAQGDSITLVCMTANAIWEAVASIGNLTYA
tara:strand:- start:3539 stop:4081 length:543 start_codon:yes stop_codon:yes gene_type:complete